MPRDDLITRLHRLLPPDTPTEAVAAWVRDAKRAVAAAGVTPTPDAIGDWLCTHIPRQPQPADLPPAPQPIRPFVLGLGADVWLACCECGLEATRRRVDAAWRWLIEHDCFIELDG